MNQALVTNMICRPPRLTIILLLLATAAFAQGQAPSVQTGIKQWKVCADSADITPDGSLVAAAFLAQGTLPDSWTNKVQIWSPGQNQVIGEFRLGGFVGSPDPYRDHMLVRFAPDARHVYVYIDGNVYGLGLSDPDEIKRFPLNRPHETTVKSGRYTFQNRVSVKAMELSPAGDAIAVLWSADLDFAKAEIYALSTGRVTASLALHSNPDATQHSIAWTGNGKSMLIAMPPILSREHADQSPNVFMFDAQTGTQQKAFTTELVTKSIAVSGDRLFAVDSGSVGLTTNHNPKLKVFDLNTGKVVGQLPGRGSGVRYVVAAAAKADIVAAFTGKIKAGFDWLDLQSYSFAADTTFTVWNSRTLQETLISPKVEGLRDLRISADGKHVLFYGSTVYSPLPGTSVQVLDLP